MYVSSQNEEAFHPNQLGQNLHLQYLERSSGVSKSLSIHYGNSQGQNRQNVNSS